MNHTIKHSNTFTIECPNCEYEVENADTGSTLWTKEELTDRVSELKSDGYPSNTMICNFCDEEFTIPSGLLLKG